MQLILVPFGVLILIVLSWTMLVPYIRGRRDLLTSFNLFLLGSLNFVGVASIQTGLAAAHYAPYDDWVYIKFVAGGIVFFVSLYIAYFRWEYPRLVASRRWRRWAGTNSTILFITTFFCGILVLAIFVLPGVRGLDTIIFTWALDASVFAAVLSGVAWARQPYNPVLWIAVCCSAPLAVIMALSSGIGRQPLLTLFLSIAICAYWLSLRYRAWALTLLAIVIPAFVGFTIIAAFGRVRHETRSVSMTEHVWTRIQGIGESFLSSKAFQGDDSPIGSDAVEVSLLAIYHYDTWGSKRPFFTIYYIFCNPIPRSLWSGKPVSLGESLPHDVGAWRTGYINWGPGIVGHGFYEGGFPFLIFYAVLIGWLLRFFDEILTRQSDNPYVLAIFCSISGQVIAYSRGDFAIFGMLIIGAVTFGLTLNWVMRLFFGTAIIYSPEALTDNSEDLDVFDPLTSYQFR